MNWWALSIAIVFVVLVLFLSITMYWTVKWPNWHQDPYDALSKTVQQLGIPSSSDYSSGGMAVWDAATLKNRNQPWRRVILRDEAIPSCCPEPHTDFLYSSVCIDLADALVESMILGISESMWYDSLKNRLWIRRDSIQANTATALFVTQFIITNGESVAGQSFDNMQDLYDWFWANTDAVQAAYAAMLKSVTGASDDDYQKYVTQLQADLNALGCPDLTDCDDADCDGNPWEPANFQKALSGYNIDTIPPADSTQTENYTVMPKTACGESACSPRNQTGKDYSLTPQVVKAKPGDDKQVFTLGYPVDTSLPTNALNLTRERYTPKIIADSRHTVDGQKVGTPRKQAALNGKTNHNLLLARHESAGPLGHENIVYALQHHHAGKDDIEAYGNWANDITTGKCQSCSVKRNGRPMTISAV